jgi:hypothetical protein
MRPTLICCALALTSANLWPMPAKYVHDDTHLTHLSSDFHFSATGAGADFLASAFDRYTHILPTWPAAPPTAKGVGVLSVNVTSASTDLIFGYSLTNYPCRPTSVLTRVFD